MQRVYGAFRLVCGIALTVLLIGGACDRQQQQAPAPVRTGEAPAERVVARVGGREITIDDMQELINRETAFIRSRYSTPEKLKEYLDSLVRFELLFQEAERRGYGTDPDIVRIFKQQMVARLMQRDFDNQHDPMRIPEDVLRQYWENHKQQFNQPEQARVSHILIVDTKVADTAAQEARKLNAEDDQGWNKLVELYSSDVATRPLGGDLGYLSADTKGTEPEILAAAFTLTERGSIAGPVRSNRGYHIIRLADRRPAMEKTFDDVRKAVHVTVFKEQRETALKDWVAGLRAKTEVQIMEENVDKVQVDLTDVRPKDTSPPFFQLADDFLPGLQDKNADKTSPKPAGGASK